MSLLLAAVSLAAEPIVSVGEEVAIPVGGGWARAVPADEGWHFLWSAGGDYNRLPMTEDLVVVDRDRVPLTGHTELVDHAVTRCPDGSFLHVASANLVEPNDSAYAFRYDADLALVAEGVVEEQASERQHNDLAVLCSPIVDGVAFTDMVNRTPWFVALDGGADPSAAGPLDGGPEPMGASFVYEPESDTFLLVGFKRGVGLTLARYDRDRARVDDWDVELLPDRHVYWPQATMRVGDHYLVAHMARDDEAGWFADEGDVWLAAFDLDWNLVQHVQITHNTPPTGGMRPGLARKNERLLVLYDKEVQPRVIPVELDLAALGVPAGQDTGVWDTGGAEEDDDGTDRGTACGCATGGGGPAAGLLAGLFAVARRPRSRRVDGGSGLP